MNEYTLRFGQTAVHMPWWWFTALIVWLGLMGLIVFFLGQRLVRPLFAVLGIVLGASITAVIIMSTWPDSLVVPWCLGAALIFGGLALALWRVWMAGVFGWFVFVMGPVAVLMFTGNGAPAIHTPIANTMHEIADAIGVNAKPPTDAPDAPKDDGAKDDEPTDLPNTGDDAAERQIVPEDLGPILVRGKDAVNETISTWWNALDGSTRWAMIAVSLGGSAIAFVLALALPYFGAAVVTAFIGTLLMLPGVMKLLVMFAPDTALSVQSSPRELALGVAAATVIGALIQWMVLRRPADK